MTEYSDFLKHLGIDKKQMLASMWSKIPDSEKTSKRGREMTKEEILKIKEHIEIHARREPYAIKITEILWRAVAELEHIAELEKEVAEMKEQIEQMKCCSNCQTVRDAEGNCYLKKDGKCKDKDKWELRR